VREYLLHGSRTDMLVSSWWNSLHRRGGGGNKLSVVMSQLVQNTVGAPTISRKLGIEPLTDMFHDMFVY
jgi:hypothetical protein